MRVPPHQVPNAPSSTLRQLPLLRACFTPYSPTMDSTNGTNSTHGDSREPPSDSTARLEFERLCQLFDVTRFSFPPTKEFQELLRVTSTVPTQPDLLAEFASAELKNLSVKEHLHILRVIDRFLKHLHILSLEVSEELLRRLVTSNLDEKSVRLTMHLLTDTLQLSVAEICFVNRMARPNPPAPAPTPNPRASHPKVPSLRPPAL